jgi:hypothetical protein
MTIILSSPWVSLQMLEPGHPARLLLYDLSAAAQRGVWKTSTMLNFSPWERAYQGAYPLNLFLEHRAEQRG